MATSRQQLGDYGEKLVVTKCSCPRCKRTKTLRQLRANFKCADLICDFCGYLAQVKTASAVEVEELPKTLLGAAWRPLEERLDAGLYFPLFVVLVDRSSRRWSIWYLAADLQERELFRPRRPLSDTAQRAGWQGFLYDVDVVRGRFVRLV